jgi:hypothetical protein
MLITTPPIARRNKGNMLERAVVADVAKKPVVWATGDIVPCQWFFLSKVDFIF